MTGTFKQFIPSHGSISGRGSGKSSVPLVSVNGSGVLRFNMAAALEYDLTAETHVLLFYSASEKMIGLKKVERNHPDCLKFYTSKSSDDTMLSVKSFMQFNDIPLKHTQPKRTLSKDKETGMILVHDVINQDQLDFIRAAERRQLSQS